MPTTAPYFHVNYLGLRLCAAVLATLSGDFFSETKKCIRLCFDSLGAPALHLQLQNTKVPANVSQEDFPNGEVLLLRFRFRAVVGPLEAGRRLAAFRHGM